MEIRPNNKPDSLESELQLIDVSIYDVELHLRHYDNRKSWR
jgi:hypothetical protein